MAEGPKIINELLSEPKVELVELFAVNAWLRDNPSPTSSSAPVHEIDEVMLSRLSFQTTPNQVLALFRKPVPSTFIGSGNISLLLDHIQDPGNLGTIIRCADWFGVKQIVCSAGSADAFSPKSIQSSMGSIARVELFYNDIADVIRNNNTVRSFAAALAGTSIHRMQRLSEGMIVIGNESRGISAEVTAMVSEKITIPRSGHAESLNAAVATGIILSHLCPAP